MAKKKTDKAMPQTTYERFMTNKTPAQRKKFEKGYRDFVLSELLIALMEEDEISVRLLAKEAGLSATLIQGIRSGTKENITLQSFLKIMQALGCSLVIKKDKHSYPLELVQH